MGKDIGDPYDLVRQGEFRPILEWLQRNIYAQGRKYTPKELITRVTGQPMSPEPYLEGLAKKYTELYGL
jgi:carboxypeptidase Taq